jgi:hypothetical protein
MGDARYRHLATKTPARPPSGYSRVHGDHHTRRCRAHRLVGTRRSWRLVDRGGLRPRRHPVDLGSPCVVKSTEPPVSSSGRICPPSAEDMNRHRWEGDLATPLPRCSALGTLSANREGGSPALPRQRGSSSRIVRVLKMWISANLGAESLTRALFLCQLGLGCLDTPVGPEDRRCYRIMTTGRELHVRSTAPPSGLSYSQRGRRRERSVKWEGSSQRNIYHWTV